MSRLKLLGTDATDMTMTTRAIVEGIDVAGYGIDHKRPILVDVLLDPLLFQAAEKGFRDARL